MSPTITRMAPSQNSVKTEVYPFIDPKNFEGKFKGRTLFVTGAGAGIGRGIAIAFAKAGANVSFVDLDYGNVMETVRLCEAEGAKALGTVCDITDFQAVDKVIEATEKRFGQIDILVNNAGINRRRPYHMMSFETFWKVIEVNFKAPMYLMHKMLPKFRARHEGCIINIASRGGTVNGPMQVQYNTGKAALIRAVGCIHEELVLDNEKNIHLYALHPGGVYGNLQTDFDEDLKEIYPDLCKKWFEWYKLFKTPAALPGQTCVYLATGAAKDVLGGRYFDCEQDIEYVVNQGRERLEQGDLYNLKVEFVGLSNDGGSAVADWEEGNRK